MEAGFCLLSHAYGETRGSVAEDAGTQDEDEALHLAQHCHVTLKASRSHIRSTWLQLLHYIHFSYLSWLLPRWPAAPPRSFLARDPARPRGHAPLVETQLSSGQVRAQAWSRPWSQPSALPRPR